MGNQIDLRSLRDILGWYVSQGFYLFPLNKRTKMPAIKNNLNLASNDIHQLMKWATRFSNCNWGLSLAKSGLVAVDIDEKGLNAWEALCFEYGEPATLKQKSGSGIGSHYVFKAGIDAKYRGKIVKGIDVKHNGYIAIYPSTHPTTGLQYEWEDDRPPVDLPNWLVRIIEKGVNPSHGKSSPIYGFAGAQWYKKIITQIKDHELDYDTWVRFGMALHSAFKGSNEGLDLFLDLSSGLSYQEGDFESAKTKWDSFTSDDSDSVGIGSFVYLAKSLGCTIPTPGLEEDLKAFESRENGNLDAPKVWFKNRVGQHWSENPEFIMQSINEMGFAMLGGLYSGRIVHHWKDEFGATQFRMLSMEDFRNSTATYSFKVWGANGQARYTPASEVWVKSSYKSTYRNVVFDPLADFEDLNLWSNIPCEPLNGPCDEILELLLMLTGGSHPKREYLLKWLAHLVQKPAEKCVVVPVLIGEQGTGKGLFTDGVMFRILTNSFYVRLDKPGVIKERFNAEQARKFLTVLDESSWRGDHELVGLMKSLTGNATMTVEEKFGGRYTLANYSRYIITSNTIDAVNIEASNRRYLVLECSTAWKGTSKFKELGEKLRKGSLHRNFLGYLHSINIEDFNPYEFPEVLDTEGQGTKIASMGFVGQFIADMLYDKPEQIFKIVPDGFGVEEYAVSNSEIFELFSVQNSKLKQYGKRYNFRTFSHELEHCIPMLKVRAARLRDDGERFRGWMISPTEFFTSFCARNRLVFPVDFKDQEYTQNNEKIDE